NVGLCPNCKEPKLPHIVCPKCGYYKGKKYLKVEEL
ncbi:MAG: 50S ribosomal protein L32, partial [Proteobacteria bacterium]|nr:50S ribosomal protein L32 [Pseudomonadota bacterium]